MTPSTYSAQKTSGQQEGEHEKSKLHRQKSKFLGLSLSTRVWLELIFIKRLKKRREPVYIAHTQLCSSQCGERSSASSVLRISRDLARDFELGSEGAESLVKERDLDETFV